MRKIKIIYPILWTAILLKCNTAGAQSFTVLAKNKTYWQEVQKDSLQKMVELKSLAPDIVYDLRYATTNNFTRQKLYKSGRTTFLRLKPAYALLQAQNTVKKQGYTIKIFDAYRPYKVTKRMWDLIHDERYVADPSKGSGHNRGLAVDLTLVNEETGQELDMGTGFDNFTDSAHQSFKGLTKMQLENRLLLREVMEQMGFHPLETEWWHFYWPNNRNYAVLDLPFKALASRKPTPVRAEHALQASSNRPVQRQ